ncbi:terminase small subunit [Ornithinibacillus xuwenensis]|uniref:Terminase small subunit n=1 Tax=Ornithinibacillus xuwenensis TaxID=3144668 RepID=A0ABU9XBY1_9BACI
MNELKLTEKQKRFADYYIASGNAEESAKKAGYSARGNTTKLLQNTTIRKYIEERNKRLESNRIADMEEVKQFWTNTLRDEQRDLKDRLKASEYIAKTNAAFIDKQEHSGEIHNTVTELTPEQRMKRIKELKAKLEQ